VPQRRLAERVGSTPFFAYDRALLTGRVALLRRTLPSEVKLSYAMKTNAMPVVVQHLAAWSRDRRRVGP
jgi:diaminopimelate decarboxylase